MSQGTKCRILKYTSVINLFISCLHPSASSEIFIFVPVASCTIQVLLCFTLFNLKNSTILGDTKLWKDDASIKMNIGSVYILPSILTMVDLWSTFRRFSVAQIRGVLAMSSIVASSRKLFIIFLLLYKKSFY